MNANKLQQDHPCVIDIIRRFYLHHPPPANAPLLLDNPGQLDPSAGQVVDLLKHPKHRQVIELHVHTNSSELYFK